jgi:hypothetical protein
MNKISVPYRGERSGTAPLTWGQECQWQVIKSLGPDGFRTNICFTLEAPRGLNLAEISACIADFVNAYETLRTKYSYAPSGRLVQNLTDEGEVPIHVDEVEYRERQRACSEMKDRLKNSEFLLDEDISVRFGVIFAGSSIDIIMAMSHLASDAVGIGVLRQSLKKLLDAASSGNDFTIEPGEQPLDRSRFESSEKGRKAALQAIAYWEGEVRQFPDNMYARLIKEPQVPRYWNAQLRTDAVTAAASILAHRYQVTTASVILAAYSLLTARRAGLDTCCFTLHVPNRRSPASKSSVGCFRQYAPVRINVTSDSLEIIAHNARTASLRAYLHGSWPQEGLNALLAHVEEERGIRCHLGARVNILTGILKSEEVGRDRDGQCNLRELEGASEFSITDKRDEDSVVTYFDAWPARLTMLADTKYFTPEEIESFLRGVQSILVAAASDTSQEQEIASITEFPIDREDRDWVFVDHCWVNMRETERMLEWVLKIEHPRVFLDSNGQELIAQVPRSAEQDIQTYRSRFEIFREELTERSGVMVPHRFVFM